MKNTLKNLIALILQTLLRQTWVRKLGQSISAKAPWLKRKLLKLIYNNPHSNSPEKIIHQGFYEERLTNAVKQRSQGHTK